jgi:hypothetical protein
MITIELSEQEALLAAIIGVQRHYRCEIRGSKQMHGFESSGIDSLANDVHGAGGEIAAARALKLYWPATVDTFGKPDLGENTQVRTAQKDHYCLIVRESAKQNEIYVHVTGRLPFYKVWGYIKASDAMDEQYKKAPNNREPAYFIPADKLTQIN